MDDLIKREDALDAILDDSTDTVMKAWFNVKNIPSVEPTELYDYVFKAGYDKGVKDAPSIDIVRCNECNAYMTDGYADGCGFCAYHHSVVQADDFCSYGKERANNDGNRL